MSKLNDGGADVPRLADDLAAAGVLIEPVTVADAAQAGSSVGSTRAGCSASATAVASRRLAGLVLTADRAWSALDAGVEVRQVL